MPRALCALAMTWVLQGVRCKAGRRGGGTPPLQRGNKRCSGAGRCGHRPLRKCYKECGGAGRCGHRPLRKRILWCVGEGLSCPPSCQPTDGHCCARQSGHFLETGSLHPPLAALRRFPLPRATARVAPTEGYKRCGGVKNPPVTAFPCQPPLGKGAMETGDADCEAGVRTGLAMTVLFFTEAVLRTVFAGVAGGGATGRKLLA